MELVRLDPYRWLIPREGKMRVDGLIFADRTLMRDIRGDESVQQVANVAQLPGIVGRSIGMPDIHWGYGFAIGGVAAFDPEEGGVVSPGGVGYDINCGVRLLRSTLAASDLRPHLSRLMDELYSTIPAGIGMGYCIEANEDVAYYVRTKWTSGDHYPWIATHQYDDDVTKACNKIRKAFSTAVDDLADDLADTDAAATEDES